MMNKKAFSLVELIISVVLLGIIATFLYTSVSNLEKNNRIFSKTAKDLETREKVIDLLYNDIFVAKTLKITGNEYSTISMQTKNSLFEISQPYVTWAVSRDKKTLLRFESVKKYDENFTQNSDYFHISKVGENCEVFKIYQSNKKKYALVHIQFKDKQPLIYEFVKPLFQQKVNNKNPNILPGANPAGQNIPGGINPSNNNNQPQIQPGQSVPINGPHNASPQETTPNETPMRVR